ncbi:hypothetical protein ACQZ48_22420 [Agrobacterium sp. 22-209-1]
MVAVPRHVVNGADLASEEFVFFAVDQADDAVVLDGFLRGHDRNELRPYGRASVHLVEVFECQAS